MGHYISGKGNTLHQQLKFKQSAKSTETKFMPKKAHLHTCIYFQFLSFMKNSTGDVIRGSVKNSDNGSISQNILLESELFVMQNVDMGIS